MHVLSKLPRPRFSLRLLLVVVTLSALGFGGWRIFWHERLVTEKETAGVKVGMTPLEVRWRLGAPHHTFDDEPFVTSWGFDYVLSEEKLMRYFNVIFEKGRVVETKEERRGWG